MLGSSRSTKRHNKAEVDFTQYLTRKLPSMKTKELEAYLWGAANILRGLIDAADFKQYIFPLLFFKRISDLWDEEYQQALKDSEGDLTYAEFGEQHRFQIPKGCHWEDVRKKTTNVGAALQKALNGIEKSLVMEIVL